VVIGIQNLPKGESFRLQVNGTDVKPFEPNQWRVSQLQTNQVVSLQFWYGQQECTLTAPMFTLERGFGQVTHLTEWSCPGLLGYEMIDIDGLLVGQSEVTVGLWRQLKGDDIEDSCGANCPKSNINWLQTLEFANQMSMMEGLEQCYTQVEGQRVTFKEGCKGYRLPLDTEWMMFSSKSHLPYADAEDLESVGWVKSNSEIKRHPVCEKTPNGFGLCDVTGNVWEWCWDTAPNRDELRRVRGGGFTSAPEVALRDNPVDFPAHVGVDHIGFRLVRTR
jgi:hypothetical protein